MALALTAKRHRKKNDESEAGVDGEVTAVFSFFDRVSCCRRPSSKPSFPTIDCRSTVFPQCFIFFSLFSLQFTEHLCLKNSKPNFSRLYSERISHHPSVERTMASWKAGRRKILFFRLCSALALSSALPLASIIPLFQSMCRCFSTISG